LSSVAHDLELKIKITGKLNILKPFSTVHLLVCTGQLMSSSFVTPIFCVVLFIILCKVMFTVHRTHVTTILIITTHSYSRPPELFSFAHDGGREELWETLGWIGL